MSLNARADSRYLENIPNSDFSSFIFLLRMKIGSDINYGGVNKKSLDDVTYMHVDEAEMMYISQFVCDIRNCECDVIDESLGIH